MKMRQYFEIREWHSFCSKKRWLANF